MRLALAAITLILAIACANAAPTFHGDEQRSGNFSANALIIPSLLWKAELTGLVGAQPVYYNGYLFVTNWYGWGSWNPGLYCLNASDGSIVWRNENITGASTVAVFGNTLVVGSLSGKLYFVNATSGKVEKELALESSPSWWGIASSPLIYNGSIYVTTFSNGTLWKIDSGGNIIWKFTTGGEISHYTSPTAYDGRIFFAGNVSGQNRLYCIYENRSVAWSYDVDEQITNTPSVGYGKVFFATKNSFYALHLNGTLAWRITFNGTISTAALAYGNVYVGSKDEKLYCINASTGQVLWTFKANGKIDSSPAIAAGYVYFATNTPEGTIYALNATSGEMMWYYRLKPPSGSYYNIMSSPFIVNDKLFIGADSGYVYCFSTTGKIVVNVTLFPGTFTLEVNGNSYTINRTSALGALYYASLGSESGGAEIGFNFTLDDSWYATYGSLFLTSIFGVYNNPSTSKYWMYWVNDVSPSVGINQYQLSNGDVVYYWYDVWTATPANASIVLQINVDIKSVGITSFTASNGQRGGNVTAYVNVSVADSGWYVLVVSGTNSNGECIAGVSTFYLQSNQELRVPVIVHVPQEVQPDTFKLYAGVYKLENYPQTLLNYYGYVESEVS